MGNDNASSALKFAIGLVITMIFIGIVIVAFTFGRNHANNAISSMSKDTSQLEEGRYTQYDGAIITGAEVLNVIQRFEADDICIAVDTDKKDKATVMGTGVGDASGAHYIKADFTATTKRDKTEQEELIRNAKDVTKNEYINPSAEFYGKVKRSDTTGAIQGINFFRIN